MYDFEKTHWANPKIDYKYIDQNLWITKFSPPFEVGIFYFSEFSILQNKNKTNTPYPIKITTHIFLSNNIYACGISDKKFTKKNTVFKIILFTKIHAPPIIGNKLKNPNNMINGIRGKTKTFDKRKTDEKDPLINMIYGNTNT